MSLREAWLSALGIFVLALAVRVVAASVVVFPIPEDTAYYFGVARNLAEGRGLVSDALWSYSTPPLVLPRPAFEIWLPLPTLLVAPLMALAGPTFRVAQAMPVVVGALVPVLAWRLAADVAAERGFPNGRARSLALGAGITASVELPLLLHSTLPDSTMLFAALAVGACILMERIVRAPGSHPAGRPAETAGDATPRIRLMDPRLLGLGALLGLAALTRNEAAWLALAWAVVAWRMRGYGSPGAPAPEARADAEHETEAEAGAQADADRTPDVEPFTVSDRLRLIAVPAVVAIVVFGPWALRDWAVFGSPFPGQALTNAFFVTGFDVFAYLDPPTLTRYLAQGWTAIVGTHVDGVVHNLVSVLLVPSFPIGLIGLIALPWTARRRADALRPLLIFGVITFLVTSLAFPVATTWGTFLHASGPAQVLLLVSCLLALDSLIVRVGVVRRWTRPVAWLGPTLTAATAVLFSLSIVAFGAQSADIQRRYEALHAQLAALGADAGRAGPVVTDFPIWFAESQRAPALGLPNEGPSSVAELANRFGARYLVISSQERGIWPGVIDSPTGPGADCFREVPLRAPADALRDTRIWEIVCR